MAYPAYRRIRRVLLSEDLLLHLITSGPKPASPDDAVGPASGVVPAAPSVPAAAAAPAAKEAKSPSPAAVPVSRSSPQ